MRPAWRRRSYRRAALAWTVLLQAIERSPVGQRKGLFERLMAWGRMQGKRQEVLAQLRGRQDPDAAVLAAELAEELGGTAEALTILRQRWKRFPGHRRLQSAYVKVLARVGDRAELERVTSRIVALTPSDPMPWLQVVDSNILMRDAKAARKLIDRLLERYPRHAVLIESLIDREQRLPDDRRRLERMFEALLRSAPKQPQYLEQYAEWVLSVRNTRSLAKAKEVLERLTHLEIGRYEGLRRMAGVLQAHGHMIEAHKILLRMRQEFPGRSQTERLLAILHGQSNRPADAAKLWDRLLQLPEEPTVEDRHRAAEARRNLTSLSHHNGWTPVRVDALRAKLDRAELSLGDTLLLLEMVTQQEEVAGGDGWKQSWLDGSHRGLQRWSNDPEVTARLASAQLRRGLRVEAFDTLSRLERIDPGAARFLLVDLAKLALAAGDTALAARVEAVVLGPRHATPLLLLRLGEVHQRFGDIEGASKLYRKAAAENPADTRAAYRLAQLFRLAGEAERESTVLRDIVVQTADADELQSAGQRLLTLAMASGSCGDLLRWLDAITPQHPRRSIIERFRLLAYDAWLRGEALERHLSAEKRSAPAASTLTEALSSGDLAVQVRALRQVAKGRGRLSLSLARRLMKDDSAVVRRDTVLALASSGSLQATKLLVEMDVETTHDVLIAQLLALGQLPSVPAAEPFLVSQIRRSNSEVANLATLAVARVGGVGALSALTARLKLRRRGVRSALLLAAGNLAGRFARSPQARSAVDVLIDDATASKRIGKGRVETYAALWGLAAADTGQSRAVLLERAVEADSVVTRRLALVLAAAETPRLGPNLWQIELDWSRKNKFSDRIVRRLLMPYLSPIASQTSRALASVQEEILPVLRTGQASWTAGRRRRWCEGFSQSLEAAPAIRDYCAN